MVWNAALGQEKIRTARRAAARAVGEHLPALGLGRQGFLEKRQRRLGAQVLHDQLDLLDGNGVGLVKLPGNGGCWMTARRSILPASWWMAPS